MGLDIIKRNVAPATLLTGAIITNQTAPSTPVWVGGAALIGAALFLFGAKNARNPGSKLAIASGMMSGLCGHVACLSLGGNGLFGIAQEMLSAQRPDVLAVNGLITVANAFFWLGNNGVSVHGIRKLSDKPPSDFQETNWNGVAWGYALGGFTLSASGLPLLPTAPGPALNLISAGLAFAISGLSGLSKKPIKGHINDVGHVFSKGLQIITPLWPDVRPIPDHSPPGP